MYGPNFALNYLTKSNRTNSFSAHSVHPLLVGLSLIMQIFSAMQILFGKPVCASFLRPSLQTFFRRIIHRARHFIPRFHVSFFQVIFTQHTTDAKKYFNQHRAFRLSTTPQHQRQRRPIFRCSHGTTLQHSYSANRCNYNTL